MVLEGCLKFQGSFKDVSRKFLRVYTESLKGISRKSIGRFKEVSGVFQGSFKEISRVF